jgi:ABC-2 type transport system ATP-binding protein
VRGEGPRCPALSARGVTKHFGHRSVLRGVDLDVHGGEAVALVGENGSGKTTLLRICAGLLAADAGSVVTTGRIGYCPQEATFLESLRVDEHLVLFGAAHDLDRAAALDRGHELLAELDFSVSVRHAVRELSGGAKQKLNLALALLGDPALLLLDEPYQGFDWQTYLAFWDLAGELRARGTAIVVISHLVFEQDRFDRICQLKDGRIEAEAGGHAPAA